MTEIDPWVRFDEIVLAEPETLDERERRLQAFGWLRTDINHDGLHGLLFNSAGDLVPLALQAAREVHAHELAALIERAIAPLGEPYPTDRTTRQEILERLGDPYEDSLEQLDAAYLELEAHINLDATMARLLTRQAATLDPGSHQPRITVAGNGHCVGGRAPPDGCGAVGSGPAPNPCGEGGDGN